MSLIARQLSMRVAAAALKLLNQPRGMKIAISWPTLNTGGLAAKSAESEGLKVGPTSAAPETARYLPFPRSSMIVSQKEGKRNETVLEDVKNAIRFFFGAFSLWFFFFFLSAPEPLFHVRNLF